ncbi:hypothetical protein GCM10023223_32280 [Stackebrandtia albiflava]
MAESTREHHLQHVLGACFGALALGMVVATVLGIWLQSPGGPVVIPDPDKLVRGGCAVPLSEDQPTDYIGIACDDPDATILVLDLVGPVEAPGRPGCPFGTDQIIPVYEPPMLETPEPSESGEEPEEPVVDELICARNLYPPHPGDPGAGGGLLVAGDCAAVVEDLVVETPCDGSGEYAAEMEVLAIVGDADDCPDGTETGQEPTGDVYPMWPDLLPEEPGQEFICTRVHEVPAVD